MSMIIPNVEEFVAEDHSYRRILRLFDWTELRKPLRSGYSQPGRRGSAVEQVFRCFSMQFLEDKSDRQMQRFLKDSFLSAPQMPFEGVFSKMSQRARYRRKLKVYFQTLMEGIVHNKKPLLVIGSERIPITS